MITARRAAFWGGVALVGGVLTPFGMHVVAARFPQLGLAKFVNFTYGNTQAGS